MIVVYHSNSKIDKVILSDNSKMEGNLAATILAQIQNLASEFPNEKIVWCHSHLLTNLNLDFINASTLNDNSIVTFNPFSVNYFPNSIGYVESSPFIKINKKVAYPTWQMSSHVGFAHASVFSDLNGKIENDSNFDYYLNSLAKIFMPIGLFCYSEPKLLIGPLNLDEKIVTHASRFTLYKFVKQHFKTRWVFLLFLDFILYEKKITLLPLLASLFYKNQTVNDYDLSSSKRITHNGINEEDTVDVLIPTIGRKKYLYDVLCDLKNQTHLPKNVIIIEQNADVNAISELDYLTNETWPFQIEHTFTNVLGACNARNIGLDKVQSKWLFLADDDIRFENHFVHDCILNCKDYNKKAITLACLKSNETIPNVNPFQFQTFGSGCSFIASDSCKNVRFDMGYEFGFGEDKDFGMQLRNNGVDVAFFPYPRILHLKAPIGGFRTKFKFEWEQEAIQPKPSPNVMLYKLSHGSKEEIDGYKTILFFKYYKKQPIKNPMAYLSIFKKQWERSVFWANQLKTK